MLPTASTLRWFTALHALRILTEIEEWRRDPTPSDHTGHPWTTLGPIAADILTRTTQS
jgi:hypothetical protein